MMMLREEGVRGLYAGFSVAMIGTFVSTGIYFGAYEMVKRRMIENGGFHPAVCYFAAGSFGDLVAGIVHVPTEIVKTRLQLQGKFNNPHSLSSHNYPSTFAAFKSIWKARGIRGMYYGWVHLFN